MMCPNCPDLQGDRMPPGWKPRARCCKDEHIDRRLNGDPREASTDGAVMRARSRQEDGYVNRRERRKAAATKGKS